MGAVRALMNALATHTGARWVNTGGGCMAVEVSFGESVGDGMFRYEILITDREDVFGAADWNSNDDVSGFHALLRVFDPVEGVHPDESAVLVYRTAEDAGVCLSSALAGDRVVNLAAEVDRCAVAVESVVEMVLRAERDGRKGDWSAYVPRGW